MTDLEKDKILLLAHSIGKMARELQSIEILLKEIADTPQTETKTETQNSNLTFEKADERCKGCNHYKFTCDLFSEICRYEPKDEPRTDRLVQTNVIELPDTHQKVVFEREITEEDDCIKIGEWKYKGFEEE